MKPIIAWVKKNLAVVISTLVMVIALPLAWFFSQSFNAKVLKKQETAAAGQLQKVQASPVNYNVPMPVPGMDAVTQKIEPNAKLTEHYKKLAEQIRSQMDVVVREGVEFNRGMGKHARGVGRDEHKVLVEGLFPGLSKGEVLEAIKKEMGEEAFVKLAEDRKNAQAEQRIRDGLGPRLREMEDVLLAKGGKPNLYRALLDGMHAGTPPDPGQVRDRLQAEFAQLREKISPNRRELTPEEKAKVDEELSLARLGLYQARARSISVYASEKNLPVSTSEWRGLPTPEAFKKTPALVNENEFFVYQWDYWLLSDIAAAMNLVNKGGDGRPTDVEHSVVKRVERIAISQPTGYTPADAPASSEPVQPGATPPADVPAAPVPPLDMSVSITGRTSGPANDQYDVRVVDVQVVVSSARLPEFLSAIARTNFMTVIGVSLSEVDVFGDLAKGYAYGTEHVVRAQIKIETVWLRSWVAPLMPESLRTMLKVKLPAAPATPEATNPQPPK